MVRKAREAMCCSLKKDELTQTIYIDFDIFEPFSIKKGPHNYV